MKRLLIVLAACGGSQTPPPTTSNTREPAPPAEVSVETETVEPASPQTGREQAIEQARDAGILGNVSGSGAVVSSDPSTPTTRDKAEIRRIIRTKLDAVRYCYENELSVDATLQGTTTVSFTIDPDGTVSSSAGRGFNANVDACIAAIVKSLVFPPAPGVTNVNYPFAFRQAPASGGDDT